MLFDSYLQPCHCSGAPEHVYMEAIVDGVNIAPREQMDNSVEVLFMICIKEV